MPPKTNEHLLRPSHILHEIQTSEAYLEEKSRANEEDRRLLNSGETLSDKDNERINQMRTKARQRALAKGALSIASELEAEHGEYDLRANLFALVGNLESFYESSQKLDTLREKFDSPYTMPPDVRYSFYKIKDQVTEFNHALREVINAGTSKFNFAELLDFMTTIHVANGGQETAHSFHQNAREALVGMRNEMAYEQALILAGIPYELGDIEDEARGGDFIIMRTPIDVKSSPEATEQAKKIARQHGRNPDLIIWSRLSFADFKGALTLPHERALGLANDIKSDIRTAVLSHRGARAA
jgi:hypothetical protein